MKIIDKKTWKRKTTYDNFIKYSNPVFSVGTRLDVTELLEFCKKEGKSFFTTFLYFVTESANQVEELHTRIMGDEVVFFERVNPSYILMLENEALVTCNSKAEKDFEKFYENVRNDIDASLKMNTPKFNEEKTLDCMFISCLPWTDFTSIINPYDFNDKETTSIPRITWGKYVENTRGRIEMGIDVSAHHALIDGRQISKFYEILQSALLHPEKFIGGENR